MDETRHVSDKKTEPLQGFTTQHQPSQGGQKALLPSLSTIPENTVIANRYLVQKGMAMSGGEADVFCCLDKTTNQRVAVKIYRGELRPKVELLRMLHSLDHKNIIKSIKFGIWRDRFVEVMEYAEGGNLAQGMPYNEDFICKVVLPQLLEGLHFLHNNGIIHRDLKPSNIFFQDTEQQELLIADYGTSSIIQDWEGSRHLTTARRGTIDYLAPEVFFNIFGIEVDYYSLGITMLFLLTGVSPFEGIEAEYSIMYCHATERIEPPEKCTQRFKNLIAGLLHKERRERWGYEEVKRWLNGEDVPVPSFTSLRSGFNYKLAEGKIAANIEELGILLFNNPEEAKKHIQKRLLYDAIKVYDQALACNIDDIQSSASSLEACFIEIVYTLNPALPYRLMEGCEAHTPQELARLIDRDEQTWKAGREQLHNGSIIGWLQATGYGELAEAWTQEAMYYSPPKHSVETQKKKKEEFGSTGNRRNRGKRENKLRSKHYQKKKNGDKIKAEADLRNSTSALTEEEIKEAEEWLDSNEREYFK